MRESTLWPTSPRARVIGVALFAALLVASAFEGATVHLPALLLRTVVAIGCFFLWPSHPPSLRVRDLAAPAVALGVVAVGLARTANVGPALQASVTVLLVVALFTALAASESDLGPALLRVAAAVGVVHAVWAVVERLGGAGRASAGFFNPNYLAAFLAPLAVLALDELQTGRDRGRRSLAAIVCAVLFAGILASGSRSALAASVAGMLVALWPALRRRPWMAAAAALVAAGSTAVVVGRWLGEGDPYAYARLTHIWPRSALLALKSPLGVGLSGYQDAMRVFGIPFEGWVRYPRLASNAHSEPINAWVELGWLGLVATVAAPAAVAVSLWHQRATVQGGPHGARDSSTKTAAHAAPLRPPCPPRSRQAKPDRERPRVPASAVRIPPVQLRQRSTSGERPWTWHAHWGVLVTLAIPAAVSASLHGPPLAFLCAVWAAHVTRGDIGSGRTVRLGIGRRGVALVCGPALLVALSGAISVGAMNRAVILRDRGDSSRAVAYAELGEAAAPYSLGAAMLGESLRYLDGGQRDAAIENLLELADRYPSSVRPVERATLLLEEVAETPAAWKTIARLRREAIARDPLAVEQRLALGRALLRAGDPAGALVAFGQTLAVEPHCAAAHAYLAMLSADAANLRAARRHARAAIEASAARAEAPERGAQVLFLPPELETMLRERDLLEP